MRVSKLALAIVPFAALLPVEACTGDDPDAVNGTNDAGPSVDSGATTSSSDAQLEDSVSHDAPPAPRCDPAKPFGTPTLVKGTDLNTTGNESYPTLTSDETTIIFRRWTNSGGVIRDEFWWAHRANDTDPFAAPVLLPNVANEGLNNSCQSFSADGLTLFFSSNRPPSKLFDLWFAVRSSPMAEFQTPNQVAGLNTPSDESCPFEAKAAGELWFDSERPNGRGGSDIWRAPRLGNGFGAAVNVAELSSTAGDFRPLLSGDGLTVMFSSLRTGNGSKGSYDIFTAHRVNVQASFGAVSNVSEVNTDAIELAGWLSPDGCRLYFERQVSGNRDLFIAARP